MNRTPDQAVTMRLSSMKVGEYAAIRVYLPDGNLEYGLTKISEHIGEVVPLNEPSPSVV